jgi:hypothetical protein
VHKDWQRDGNFFPEFLLLRLKLKTFFFQHLYVLHKNVISDFLSYKEFFASLKDFAVMSLLYPPHLPPPHIHVFLYAVLPCNANKQHNFEMLKENSHEISAHMHIRGCYSCLCLCVCRPSRPQTFARKKLCRLQLCCSLAEISAFVKI